MANMLMIHHAATRSNERRNEMPVNNDREMRDYGRSNAHDQPDMVYGDREQSGMRQVNQYSAGDEHEGTESRYRGKDGRWRSGTRRSEYEGMEYSPARQHDERDPYRPTGADRDRRRSGGDDEEEEDRDEHSYKVHVAPSNVVEWPYANPPESIHRSRMGRQIGFGAMNVMGSHAREEESFMGRSLHETPPMDFDRETAIRWVRSMQNEDRDSPIGEKWSPEQLKPLAQKYGVPTDGKRFWEFYAMTNAMYSDYSQVARKFGITSPEFYVCMAKAWMDDKDAYPEKTALYYEYIVKKEDMDTAA